MRTISLLSQLINAIYQNPAVIPSLPLEEISACILTEYDLRRQLYPQEQYQSITDDINQSVSQFKLGAQFMSSQAAIDILKKFQAMLLSLPDLSYSDAQNERVTFLEAYYRHRQVNTVVVLGDSHANFFSGNEALTYEPIGHDINLCPQINQLPFTVFHLGSCLAYKSFEYGSTCHFREKAEYLVHNFIKPGAKLLICLGEIDLRMHVWKQVEKTGHLYTDIVDNIIDRYKNFLASLQEKGFDVNVWSPIASQSDNTEPDPSFPRCGTEVQRNKATLYFCDRLENICSEHQIGFYSITHDLIDANYRSKVEYLCADHCHLSQRASKLAEGKINLLYS